MKTLPPHVDIPRAAGTYALLLLRPRGGLLKVGRLGVFDLPAGWYIYIGSAFGPGGLRARIAHHSRVAQRPHWHIDALRAAADLVEVWYCVDAVRREHEWAASMAALRGAKVPIAGFGSSDCRCRTHLFAFSRRPGSRTLRRCLYEGTAGSSSFTAVVWRP